MGTLSVGLLVEQRVPHHLPMQVPLLPTVIPAQEESPPDRADPCPVEGGLMPA